MPKTMAQHERSLHDPAICELLNIRDFLDGVMVRNDGCYVAGYRVAGALTYFADDDGRNEAKTMLESLLRAIREQSMRLQFRYEVIEGLNNLLDQYRDASRSENPQVQLLDGRRMEVWAEKERHGGFLTRIAAVYLVWDPVNCGDSGKKTAVSLLFSPDLHSPPIEQLNLRVFRPRGIPILVEEIV